MTAVRLMVSGVMCAASIGVACNVTYEWVREEFRGPVRLRAYLTNSVYRATGTYTVVGIWKKLEGGKVVASEVSCTDVENVALWDEFHPGQTFANGATIVWLIQPNLITVKPTLASLENGEHTYRPPETGKGSSHVGNQLTKQIAFVPQQ